MVESFESAIRGAQLQAASCSRVGNDDEAAHWRAVADNLIAQQERAWRDEPWLGLVDNRHG